MQKKKKKKKKLKKYLDLAKKLEKKHEVYSKTKDGTLETIRKNLEKRRRELVI